MKFHLLSLMLRAAPILAEHSTEGLYTRPGTSIEIRLTTGNPRYAFTDIELERVIRLLDQLPAAHLDRIKEIQADDGTYVDGQRLHVMTRYYEASGETAEESLAVAIGLFQFDQLSECDQRDYRAFWGPDFSSPLWQKFAFDYNDWVRVEAPMLKAWSNPGLFAPALFMASLFYSSDTQKTTLYEYERGEDGRLRRPLRTAPRIVDMRRTATRLEMGPFHYTLRDNNVISFGMNEPEEAFLSPGLILPSILLKRVPLMEAPTVSPASSAVQQLTTPASLKRSKRPSVFIGDRPDRYPRPRGRHCFRKMKASRFYAERHAPRAA